jgi:hypothetical protein
MDTKNTIPKSVRKQMAIWASLGGIARRKRLTIIQRKTIARNAGIASGKARRKNGR